MYVQLYVSMVQCYPAIISTSSIFQYFISVHVIYHDMKKNRHFYIRDVGSDTDFTYYQVISLIMTLLPTFGSK